MKHLQTFFRGTLVLLISLFCIDFIQAQCTPSALTLTNAVNGSISGAGNNIFTRAAIPNSWNSAAVSSTTLGIDEGISFTLAANSGSNPNSIYVVGYTDSNAPTSVGNFRYAVAVYNAGLGFTSNGSFTQSPSASAPFNYLAGDEIAIFIENDRVKVSKNSTVIYTFTAPVSTSAIATTRYGGVAAYTSGITLPALSANLCTPPVLQGVITSVTCPGTGTDGAIDLTVTGTGTYTYEWRDASNNLIATSEDITGRAAGVYRVTVTDTGTGRSASASYTIARSLTWNTGTLVNASVNAFGELQKTAATTAWDAGVQSETGLGYGEDGSLYFTAHRADEGFAIGFSDLTTTVTDPNAIRYGMYLSSGGGLVIIESGWWRLTVAGGYKAGDRFEIKRTGTQMFYYKNGVLVRTSNFVPAAAYYVSTALYSPNGRGAQANLSVCAPIALQVSITPNTCPTDGTGAATATVTGTGATPSYAWSSGESVANISNKQVGIYTVTATGSFGSLTREVPLGYAVSAWTNQSNISFSAHQLTKGTNTMAWDSGVGRSANSLASGQDGWVAVQTVNYGQYVIGLSVDNSLSSVNSVNYGVYLTTSGSALVVKDGSVVATISGGYAMGDVFRLSREGSTFNVYKNGSQVYSTAMSSTTTLYIDAAIYSGSTGKIFTSFCAVPPPPIASKVAATNAVEAIEAMTVYPNPSAGAANLRIQHAQVGQVNVRVLDMLGREVIATQVEKTAPALEINLDLTSQKKGMYVVEVTLNDTKQMIKLIKE